MAQKKPVEIIKYEDIRPRLFAMQDTGYKAFHCKLVPTMNPDIVIGIRTPQLRAFAKQLAQSPDADRFLAEIPHQYYEEYNLHGFILETMKDYDRLIELIDEFLPYVDNWATCDLVSPKVFKKHLPELLPEIRRWMSSTETYTVRFGIGTLMSFYLDDAFKPEYLQMVAAIHSEEYYVRMMIAWFFATALAKQYEATLPYIEQARLDKWTHNKAIQKAVESNRITGEQKAYLKTLKIK